MRPSIFIKAMLDQRWMVAGFGIGSALMAALLLSVYPSYREALEDFELPPAFEALIGDVDIASPEGFVSAEFFSWIPALLVVYAIIQGTGVLAAEEGSGTLELLLAQPVSRMRVFIEKTASILAGVIGIVLLTLPGWIIGYPFADMDLGLDRLVWSTLALAPITLAFAALSVLAGTVLASRKEAALAVTVLAVVSFFVNSLGQAADVLEPLRPASLFYHFHADTIVSDGVDPLGMTVLLATAIAATALAAYLFRRRDIGIGAGRDWFQPLLRALPIIGTLSTPADETT